MSDILENMRVVRSPFRLEDVMPNRYVCSVLEEMREMCKTMRFDRCMGLIEECQTYFNRMEAKLYDYSDINFDDERAAESRRERKKLGQEVRKLKNEKAQLEDEIEDLKSNLKQLGADNA